MKRKIVSILMVAVILTATIPFDFFQLNIDNKAIASGNTVILDDGRAVTLPLGVPKQITVKGKIYPINRELLADSGITSVPNLDSGIAVYGTYNDVKIVYGNEYDSQSGEWRYIGFDINGNKYSNPDFPPDADSGRSPSQKNWQSLDYIYSIDIEYESPYYEDKEQAGEWLKTMVWVRDIDRGGKTPDEYDSIWLAEHFHILSPPTEYTAGLARGWHKSSSGKLWYQTFVMPPLKEIEIPENPPSITADFELKDEVYEYQDVGYKDTSYAEYSTIEYRKLTINGDNGYSNVIENSTSPTIKLKEGNYTFTLEVRNNAGQTDTITKNITVIKQQEEVPSKAIAIINGPNEVPINQNFTVTGEGSFPSTGAKIIEFKWYIGTDPINLIHSPTYDNQSSIYVSYSTEGDRYFKLWIKDSAGKEAWSNIHYTKINSGIVASAKAKINVPSYGYEGVPFSISTHGSYVTVEGEKYSLKKAVELGYADYRITSDVAKKVDISPSGGEMVSEKLGENEIRLYIYPKNSNTVKDIDVINILPVPHVNINLKGTKKVNRLVEFDCSNTIYHPDYNYVASKTYIEIEELATGNKVRAYVGEAINTSFVKSKAFTNNLNLKTVFKRDGEHKATFYTEDTRGKSDSSSVTFKIKEDIAPVGNIYIKTPIYRDSSKIATIEIDSLTKSIDGDWIDYRDYYYRYDTDNDSNFNDETWIYLGRTNESNYNFEVTSIGNYQIKEIAKEKFLSSTLEEFVSDTDRLECDAISEVTVDNYAPVAEFLTRPLPYADIKILSSKDNISEVENTLNYLNSALIENGVNPIVDTYSFNNQDTSPYTKLNYFEFDPHKAGSEKNIAFDDERLYIVQCEGNHPMTSYSGSVCSLNHWIEAIDYRTGQVKWIYTLGNNINTYQDIQVRIDDKYLYVFYRGRWISVLDKLTGTEIKKNTYSFSNYPYYEKTSKVQLFFTDKYTFLNSTAFNKETLNFEEINLTTDYNYTSDLVLVNDTIQFIGVKHTNYYYGDYYDVEFYRCIYNKDTLNIESQQLIKKLVKFNINYWNYNYAISKDGYITLWNTVDDKLEIYDSNNNLVNSIDVEYSAEETFIDFVYDNNNRTEFVFFSELRKDDYITYKFFDMQGNLEKRIELNEKYYNKPVYVVRSNDKILLFRSSNNTMYVFDINTFNYNEEFASNIDTRTFDYQVHNNKYIMLLNYPFYMNNYDYEIQISKFANLLKPELLNLVDNLNWDMNSDKKYLVIIDNVNNVSDDMQEIIDKLSSNGVKVIFIGNSASRSYGNDLVNGTNGKNFEYSTNYATNMSNIADYVTSDTKDIIKPPQYIFKKGEKINYELFYSDYEGDSQHMDSGEKWLYSHNPNYFTHNDGYASFNNKWLNSPITTFEKVGKYTVKLKLRDNPKNDDRFDEYRKWSKEAVADIIIYDIEKNNPPEEKDIPLQLNVDIVGDLRVNHRVDFIINATKGSKNIDWNSLDISFDRTDYLPNTKPNALEFSRVFTQTGEHNITVTLKDVEGNPTTVTVPFTINNDLPPIADFNLTGDGKRNELGITSFGLSDNSYSNDDEIGIVEYYIEGTKYIDNRDGTYTPSGTEYYPLELNEFGEIELDKIGLNKIKQVATETYVNGIGLNGEGLDQYRVFKKAETIRTVNVTNVAPQANYSVAPNIIKVGNSISHNISITDDTPSGDYVEYKLVHDDTYFENSQGVHVNNNIVTTEPTEILDKKGKYDFYVKAYDEDGASTDWIHGGQVVVASEPIADFELVSPGNEIGNDIFEKGSVVTIENRAYNEDYENTVPNHGIKYIKVEYRNTGDDSYTTIFESNNMPDYVPTFNLPQINESGIYEVKMTVRSPEGIEATATKQFTVLDLRLDTELIPSAIYASQKYTIKATLSTDGLGAVAYIPYNNIWITLDKVSEDMDNKYYEKEITTDVDLADGIYDIEVYGVYPYNNELKEVIPLTVETPLELISDIKPIGPIKYINIIEDNTDSNDYIQVPAGEKIQITADVTSPVTVEYVKAQLEGESEINLTYNSSLDIYEGEINIPAIKLDKDYYVLSIETSTPNGNTDINNHRIKVDTPVDLMPDMPSELTSDTTAIIKAETSKYVETLTVTLYKGESFKETLNMTVDKIVGNKKEWVVDYDVPTGLTEGTYTAEFRAETYNGNIEIDSEEFKLFSLDLSDLRITHIYNHPNYEDKYPILYNDPMVPAEYKTGYYITFKINAKGSPDLVKMRISFFGYDKEFNMKKESENGTESVWKLEWYADSFTPFGTIINTQVTAYKGQNALNFNDKYNWNGDFLKITGTIEQDWRIDQEF